MVAKANIANVVSAAGAHKEPGVKRRRAATALTTAHPAYSIKRMQKAFTVESANRTLPLVRRIVEDLVRQYGIWQARLTVFEAAAAGTPSASRSEMAALQKEVQDLATEIEGYVDEIAGLGAETKVPLDAGLVDFPGELDGRPVYLCWRLGEASVEHWHEIDAGFAGRQPLNPLPASAESP